MSTELVHVARRGPVRTLTIDSPANRNALSASLLDELAEGLADATEDDAVRVIVLSATGRVFCSGADLSAGGLAVTSRLPQILSAIASAKVPVITRVAGHVRGGGIGLIVASDLSVATDGCTFAFSEVRIGVAPAIILVPALRVVERRFLARATLTGEPFSASEAVTAGVLCEAVSDESALDQWVARTIASILKCAPGAVAATKALVRDLPALSWSEGLAAAQARSTELFAGAEGTEGMDAFLHKRAPSWEVDA